MLLGILLVLSIISIVYSDVRNKMDFNMQKNLNKISECKYEYYANKCDTISKPEVIEKFCLEKLNCIKENPNYVLMNIE